MWPQKPTGGNPHEMMMMLIIIEYTSFPWQSPTPNSHPSIRSTSIKLPQSADSPGTCTGERMVGHPTASGFFARRRQFPAAGRDPGDGHWALYPYQARHNYATTNVRDIARQIRGKWRGRKAGGRIHLIVTFNGAGRLPLLHEWETEGCEITSHTRRTKSEIRFRSVS